MDSARSPLPLEWEDQHRLLAVEGWLELGNPDEARLEFEHLPDGLRNEPPILSLQFRICAAGNNWPEAYRVAERHVEISPEKVEPWINRSNALHFQERYQDTVDRLLPAVERFPENDVIPYNLSCHLARLGRLDEAWTWLQEAIQRRDLSTIKARALEDLDLKALWDRIAGL
jgi:tetratricopeptide (TPR) repeat protein